MYYVYHGYCSPDNYDSSEGPTYRLTPCEGTQEVMRLHAEHLECINDECSHVIFRVIQGSEKKMVESKSVVEYKLV